MAATVAYKVNGKADTAPIDKTKKAIENVAKAATAMKTAVAGFAVAKVFQGVNAVISGATSSFKNMNAALTKSNQAFAENAQLTQESVANIRDALNEFSAGNYFDGDSLNNAASLASQMGLNEEQIKKVMDAATEMAASGIMPLDQAVKKLSESYQGNAGDLAKLCPELKNLTEEQIKSGAAVDAMKKQYDGFRDTMSGTFEGMDKQWANSFGDLQASVGGIISSFEFLAKGEFMKPLQDLGAWISEHQTQIINFVLHLPELFITAADAIKQIFARTFSNKGMIDLGKFIVESLQNWLPVLQAYFVGVGNFIKGIFDVTFGNIGRAFYNFVIIPMKQYFTDAINNFVAEHPKIAEILHIQKIEVKAEEPKSYAKLEDVMSTFSDNIDKAKKEVQSAIDEQAKITETFTVNYKDITDEATKKINTILNADLPENLANALDAGAKNIGKAVSNALQTPSENPEEQFTLTNNEVQESADYENWIAGQQAYFDTLDSFDANAHAKALEQAAQGFNAVVKAASSAGGQMGQVFGSVWNSASSAIEANINAITQQNALTGEATTMSQMWGAAVQGLNSAMSSNIFGIILQVIVQIIGTFTSGLSNASESFGKVMNLFSTIFEPIIDAIAPLIEDVFKPFADILTSIGRIIGEMLIPIMDLANDVLVPLMSAVSGIFNVLAQIAKAVAPIVQTFMRVLNQFNIFAILFKGIAKVIELIGKGIAALYNYVLRPVCNFIIMLVEKVANGFIWVYNKIIQTFNRISIFGWHPFSFNEANEVSIGRLDKFDMDNDYYAKDDDDDDSTSGGSASYSAVSDVYVTIEFNHSYVNGDAEDIAIMLAREIRQAEKKNLV